MKIENDLKLDFSQVLIRPKRSTINSRSDVNLNRTMKFKWSPKTSYFGTRHLSLTHFLIEKR